MTFYILLNQVTTLFLSLNLLTTLSFDSEIQSYLYGGSKEDVFFQVTNNNKTLVLKPQRATGFSNLMVVTKKRKYYFKVDYDQSHPHEFIEVRDGIINHAYKHLKEFEDFEIKEGGASLLVVKKKNKDIVINGVKVERREYFSKGVPLLYEGNRILN